MRGAELIGRPRRRAAGRRWSHLLLAATVVCVLLPSGAPPSSADPTAVPAVNSLSPASGPVGTTVTIQGANFTGATSVDFNGTVADAFTVASDTEIDTTVPAGAATGPVTVTTPAGTGSSADSFTVLPPPPTVTGFSPTSGRVGDTVTITGTGFGADSAVDFNGTPAVVVTVVSDTQIDATVPAGATTGRLTVTTATQAATSDTDYTVVAPPPAPTIGGFAPTSGQVGTSVTINGSNFTGTTAVTFNGVVATFTEESDIKVTAVVPDGASTGPIRVTTGAGSDLSTAEFTVTPPPPGPAITGFSPTSGHVGDQVTITGTGFGADSSVGFGGGVSDGTPTVSADGTQLTAAVPPGATSGPLTVTTGGQTATSPATFTVLAPAPIISSFSPGSGTVGTVVTITGTNLTAATAVQFNGLAARSFTVNTDTQITATVPTSATSGPITVIGPGGSATSAASFFLLIPAPPTVSGFTPTSGPVGTVVAINGTNLTATTSVSFNGTATTAFTVVSPNQITVPVPRGAASGPLSVTTTGGTAKTGLFTVTTPVRVTGFSPASGPVGTAVTVTGGGLTAATGVAFGGVPATFSVVSDTQLTATVPAGATTGKIVVTTPAGAAASSITDFVVGTGGGGGGGGGPVTVGDTAFTPAALTTSQGTSVGWSFTGSATHTVSDSSGMGLFDSGTRSPGSSYAFRFAGAGSYAYSDKLHPTMTGRITVPVTASPASGGKTTAFTVRWGSAAAPAGYVYDVQVRKPGTAVFANWLLGRSSASASFTANAGAGTYTFQARLRRTSNAKFSGWSPAASISVTSTPVTARRYLTLLIGRSQWVTPDSSCSPLPDTVPLDQVAAALQARGLAATGAVVVNRINDNVQRCAADALYPTWQQLAMLRDSYRWTFVSAGIDYVSMPQLTAAQQQQNSCGSLPALQAHGHTNAWGLFAYPNNLYTSAMQANIVSKCFSYGRTYGSGLNCRTCMAPPWFKSTNSFSGGPCNNANLDCYFFTSGSGATRRYASPVTLGAAMSVPNDSWVVVQGYRFVTGSYSSSTYSWDCTDADWQNHWTSNSELYCWSDYLAAISQIPAGVVVTDPATVARAWGRALG